MQQASYWSIATTSIDNSEKTVETQAVEGTTAQDLCAFVVLVSDSDRIIDIYYQESPVKALNTHVKLVVSLGDSHNCLQSNVTLQCQVL